MKKPLIAALVAAVAALSLAPAAHALGAGQEAAKKKWDSMTPEEQAAAKEKAKAKWDSMTPEEQAAAKKRFAEKRPRAAKKMAEKEAGAASAAKP
ncbi:MAG: DUF3106 domain-containing protein [Rubrivivax sp.]